MEHPKMIDGQFEVLGLLGEGMSGEVYKVRRGEEIWALKLLKEGPQAAEDKDREQWIAAFVFEFSLLKDIVHPHVVRIGDFGLDKNLNRLYFTEEFIEGVPFLDFIREHDRSVAEELFIQSLLGLEAIHQAGALHCDIKPPNFFVVTQPRPTLKILDLGIAHPRFHLIAGTPAYFAPERILKEPIDERSDLYSLAVTFYEVLTGVNPFRKSSVEETFKAQTSLVPAPAGSLGGKISPYLSRILSNLLAKNPSDRYRNARQVLSEIDLERGISEAGPLETPIVSEKWIGRAEPIAKIPQWASDLKQFSVLVITGEKGLGKTRLLTEMKYALELAEHTVRQIGGNELPGSIEAALYLYDSDNPDPSQLQAILSQLQGSARGLLMTCDLAQLPDIETICTQAGIPYQAIRLGPFTKKDLKHLISQSTHEKYPPQELVDSLFNETQGNPGHVVHLFSTLCQQNDLIGPHGEWNLALFREGVVDYSSLSVAASDLDALLAQVGEDRTEERAFLIIQKIEEGIEQRKGKDCDALFEEAEQLIRKVPAGDKRLKLRVGFLEKKGWLNIREGHFDQAKRNLESSIALLDEMADPSSIVRLRLKNFLAYVASQEGKIDEAVRIFRKTHGEWERLADEDKSKVTNNDLGMALMQKGEFTEAIDIFNEYLFFYEGLEENTLRNRCNYNLGECSFRIRAYQEAIQYYQETAEGAKASKQWDLLLRAYNGLGNSYNVLKKVDPSLEYYHKALDLARYLRDYPAAAAVAQNMGVIQNELGRIEPARDNLSLSLKLIKQVKELTPYTRYLKARAILELGEIEREQKNFEKSRSLITEAAQIVMGDKDLESFAFWILQAQAMLALDENRPEEFVRLYPDLLYHAKSEDQKEKVEFLRRRSPIDPTEARDTSDLSDISLKTATPKKVPEVPAAGTMTFARLEPITISEAAIATNADASALKALLDITQFLNAERDLPLLLKLILRYALSLSGAESGLILLLDDSGELKVEAAQNIQVDEDLSQISRHVAEQALASGHSVKADDASTDEDLKKYRSVLHLGLKSIFCTPIRSQGKIIGVLYLTHRFQAGLFSDQKEKIIQAFSDQAGIAIENARLLQQIREQAVLLEDKLQKAEETISSYKNVITQQEYESRHRYADIISQSITMEPIFELLDKVTPTNLSVLVQGESGTGKELVARALHQNSVRRDHRFMAINCGALPANLVESELFGFKAGAFSGAVRDKKGLMEEATGGTLFLDEIGELDASLQVKLLRALQEKEIARLGDTKTIPIDVRLVCATHRDLNAAIKEGQFREDLYYRIAEILIELPPLRERKEDIPLLVKHFVERFTEEQDLKKAPKIDKQLLQMFMNYSWPGNVRELSNRTRVACALSDGHVVTVYDLPEGDRRQLESLPAIKKELGLEMRVSPSETEGDDFFAKLLSQGQNWRQIETLIMAKALIANDFNVVTTAKKLGVGQATLYNRLRSEKIKKREQEFAAQGWQYPQGSSLDDLKKAVFESAYRLAGGKPYHAARHLDVSPGMLYRWLP